MLARHDVPPRPGLRWTARLTTVVVGAAVVSSALVLPALATTVHVVKRGETLSSIAAGAGISSWRRLHDANPGVKNPNVIHVGQRLVIPDVDDQVAPRAVRATANRAKARPHPVAKVRKKVAPKVTRHRVTTKRKPVTVTKRKPVTRVKKRPVAASGTVWDRLAQCESGGNWHINTGNGYSGGLQFSAATWHAYGGSGSAHNASRATQIRVAKRILAAQGWGAWPACSRKLGLR